MIDQGSWARGLVRSVDHPIYPLAIASRTPSSAATALEIGNEPQVAAAISGVIVVIPVYFIASRSAAFPPPG